jgi:hypothetical protein
MSDFDSNGILHRLVGDQLLEAGRLRIGEHGGTWRADSVTTLSLNPKEEYVSER